MSWFEDARGIASAVFGGSPDLNHKRPSRVANVDVARQAQYLEAVRISRKQDGLMVREWVWRGKRHTRRRPGAPRDMLGWPRDDGFGVAGAILGNG